MRLNRIRQAIPALRKGQYSTEGCSGNMAFKRRYTDSNTDSFVCVAISGGAHSQVFLMVDMLMPLQAMFRM